MGHVTGTPEAQHDGSVGPPKPGLDADNNSRCRTSHRDCSGLPSTPKRCQPSRGFRPGWRHGDRGPLGLDGQHGGRSWPGRDRVGCLPMGNVCLPSLLPRAGQSPGLAVMCHNGG
jgi:hypothetical protein